RSPALTVVEPGKAVFRVHPWTAACRLASGVAERFTVPFGWKIARFSPVYGFPGGAYTTVRIQFCPSVDIDKVIPIGMKAMTETAATSLFVSPWTEALTRRVSAPTVVAENDVWFPVVEDRVPRFCARDQVKVAPPRVFPF